MAETPHHQLHVLAISFPFGSHPAQILNVTRRLAAAVPDVTFSFLGTAQSNASLFGSSNTCDGFDNIKVYDVDDGVADDHVFSGNPFEQIDLFFKATPCNLKMGIDKAVSSVKQKISCVMSDAFLWMAGDIAEELQVPWISVWAPGASSLSSHFHTDLILKTIQGKSSDETLSFIQGMSSVRFCDLPREICNMESTFAHMLHNAGLMLRRASAVVVNTFEELEDAVIKDMKSKLKMCFSIGPLTMANPSSPDIDDPYGCISWLDTHENSSVVYVSFGTAATPPPVELIALAEALEESGISFLWSLKDNAKSHLPCGFLERTTARGKVVPWTPQSKVLQHSSIGVFVTHCGWNSVLESIMCGVPMIYRPFFGDHMLIGRFVSHIWEIGVSVGDGVFTKDETEKALGNILRSEQGKQMKANVEALKDKAKQAVGPDGSTTKNFNTLVEMVIARHR